MRDWCIGARALFGRERGDRMHDLARRLYGNSCPCTFGLLCPILPAPKPDPEHHWDLAVSTLDTVTPMAAATRLDSGI